MTAATLRSSVGRASRSLSYVFGTLVMARSAKAKHAACKAAVKPKAKHGAKPKSVDSSIPLWEAVQADDVGPKRGRKEAMDATKSVL